MFFSSIIRSIKTFFKKIFRQRAPELSSAGPSFDTRDSGRRSNDDDKQLVVNLSNYQASILTNEEQNIYNNDPLVRIAFKNHKAEKEKNPHLFVSSSEPMISTVELPKDLEYNASSG